MGAGGVGYRESGNGEKRYCERYSETVGRCENRGPIEPSMTMRLLLKAFYCYIKGIQGFLLPPFRDHFPFILISPSPFLCPLPSHPHFIFQSLHLKGMLFFFFFVLLFCIAISNSNSVQCRMSNAGCAQPLNVIPWKTVPIKFFLL